MKTFLKILDSFLMIVILLSIVQLVADDVFLMQGMNQHSLKLAMIYSGFAFDLIFTLEFLIRSGAAIRRKGFKDYFVNNAGWIDFMASLPLLLLNSGPMLLEAVSNGTTGGQRSMLNLLKVVRAVRVTRVLRLLRILKIFGKIENVGSQMAQKHVMFISSLLITVSIAVYFALSLTGYFPAADVQMDARFSLFLTIILITVILALAFMYSAYFAKTVSDPTYIMQRGFSEEDYNLSVKILPAKKQTELFQLAESYNRIWLPLKARLIDAHRQKNRKKTKTGEDYSDLL